MLVAPGSLEGMPRVCPASAVTYGLAKLEYLLKITAVSTEPKSKLCFPKLNFLLKLATLFQRTFSIKIPHFAPSRHHIQLWTPSLQNTVKLPFAFLTFDMCLFVGWFTCTCVCLCVKNLRLLSGAFRGIFLPCSLKQELSRDPEFFSSALWRATLLGGICASKRMLVLEQAVSHMHLAPCCFLASHCSS